MLKTVTLLNGSRAIAIVERVRDDLYEDIETGEQWIVSEHWIKAGKAYSDSYYRV